MNTSLRVVHCIITLLSVTIVTIFSATSLKKFIFIAIWLRSDVKLIFIVALRCVAARTRVSTGFLRVPNKPLGPPLRSFCHEPNFSRMEG